MSDTTVKTLVEYFALEYDRANLTEAAINNPNGTVRIKSVIQRADAENQNGRVYPKRVLLREATKYNDEFVSRRNALGELDHPTNPNDTGVVSLKNASHNIVSLEWEGNDLVGVLEILSTPAGNIVKELMRNNIALGVSSRGMGSVNQTGNRMEVDDDFMLICFDIVSNPSTHGAFLQEGVQNTRRNKKIEKINDLVTDFFGEIGDIR